MKRFAIVGHIAFLVTAALVLGANCAKAGPSESALSNEAKNIARMNCGANIQVTAPDGKFIRVESNSTDSAAVLIMDDDTISCPLKEGDTTFIVALPRTSVLDRFTFVNENAIAAGELKIAVAGYKIAANSPKWTEVEGNVSFTRKRLFNVSMLGVEAKYVKLSFHVQKEGRLASLGLYGEESIEQFANRTSHIIKASNTVSTRRLEDMVNFNFANLYARARVVYVSSGGIPSSSRMIDDDTLTSFRFANGDVHPTVIVELAESERVHRVSALYKMQSGKLDVYLMNDLGANTGDLSGLTPVGTVVDAGSGKASVNFDPQGARYVALRWTPKNADGFEVAEINAFGDVPLAMLLVDQAPDVYAQNTVLSQINGVGSQDFSNSLGTLADPPVLAPVSQ